MIDTERLVRWYDFQAPFYRWWRNDYGHPIVGRVVRLLGEAGPPRALLDAGCGTGLFAIALARALPQATIDGLDASTGMLRVARSESRRQGIAAPRWVHGDLTALPYRDGSFDGAVAAGVFPSLPDRRVALGELRRALAVGARLVVVEFDRATMRPRTRAFFRLLILGYRAVALVAPRFRFARGWSLRRSTIDRDDLERDAREAGWRVARVESGHEHLFFVLERV